jgi:hypothetical protein
MADICAMARTKQTARASKGASDVPMLVMDPAPVCKPWVVQAQDTPILVMDPAPVCKPDVVQAQHVPTPAKELDPVCGSGVVQPETPPNAGCDWAPWMQYWLFPEHSHMAGFETRFGAVHATFPAVFMSAGWFEMVHTQEMLGLDGFFDTDEKYALFKEYLAWCEGYFARG